MVELMYEKEYESHVWSFYRNLEDEFLSVLYYIELTKDNYKTYSIELEKLLLSLGSEIDNLCKLLCKAKDPDKNPLCINQYAEILCPIEGFLQTRVFCNITKEEYVPFKDWGQKNSPNWWKSYNSVKHNRNDKEKYKEGKGNDTVR